MASCKTPRCIFEPAVGDEYCSLCVKEKKLFDPRQAGISKGDKAMSKPVCKTKDCGRAVQKEGICYKCYKDKHGVAPYGPNSKKSAKSKVTTKKKAATKRLATAKSRRPAGALDSLTTQIMDKYLGNLHGAVNLYNALKVIEKVTGKDLQIPEPAEVMAKG